MFKKKVFIILILLFNNSIIANNITEKELLMALKGGIKTTKQFLTKVPAYQLYEEDKTILHYAVELKKYAVIEFLIDQNMELYRQGGLFYQTALQDAIFYQYFRIARLLINSGSPLDIQNIDGDTALHIASSNGYLDMVQVLIAAGASKNIINNNGNTPYELIPKFMMDSNKEMKTLLKPKKALKLEEVKNKRTITISNEMNRGQATFVLDQMYFDDQVGVGMDTILQNKSLQQDIIRDTSMENANIGLKVYSN